MKVLIKRVAESRVTNPHAPEVRNAAPVGQAMSVIGDGVLLRADRAYSALMDRARRPEGRAERTMASVHRGLIGGAATALLIEADRRLAEMLTAQRERLAVIDAARASVEVWARGAKRASRIVTALNMARGMGLSANEIATRIR